MVCGGEIVNPLGCWVELYFSK